MGYPKRRNVKARDLARFAVLVESLGRSPSRRECERNCIWFGPRCPWPSYQALVHAAGQLTTDGRSVRHQPKPLTYRCQSCDQRTPHGPLCPRCLPNAA